MTPVKFGISFTAHAPQPGRCAGAHLPRRHASMHLNHGGTEMGQGLHTKVAQVVAGEFGVEATRVRITATQTDKVPNTGPTAASSGTDLNAMAALRAARTIRSRLVDLAARLYQVEPADVAFSGGQVHGRPPERAPGGARAPRLHRAGVPFFHRLLRHPQDHLGPRYRHRPPLPVLRLRSGMRGSHRRHHDRRDAGGPRRSPARRRPLAQPAIDIGQIEGASSRAWDG